MTMIDTLFGLIPAASTGQQWVARDLQVVNWGGYHGPHRVRLASTATLFAGSSGSGKSTLMDAYIALLMPHTTPFNGASNGGVVGRPRGKEQRNVISYARGKVDESRTADGTRERVLRGDGRDTWTAVAVTWADQSGSLFTAVRAWYVPAGVTTMDGVFAVRATTNAGFDLGSLEEAAAQRFSRPLLVAAGLTCFDTDREFAARLYSTLGIGAAGGGDKAIGLLARIQAGQQITTVDALYKAMVLEEPETLARAADVVEHFDELAGTRERMLTAQAQVRTLGQIRAHRAAIEAAAERLAVVEAVGRIDDDGAPAGLWRARRRTELLHDVEAHVRAQAATAKARVAELEASKAATEAEHEGVRQTLWAAGGDAVHTAERELAAAQARLAQVRKARERLEPALALLEVEATSAATFAAARKVAQQRIDDVAGRRSAQERRDRALLAEKEAQRELTDLERERQALAARRGNVPERLHRARVALAAAAGLREQELPFVAELLEVATEHEPWREAFNLALGGFATTLLVDAGRLSAFRKAIDSVPSAVRLRFEGVPTGLTSTTALDPQTLPGRLEFAPGPFEGWLREHLADRYSYVCVESADLLGSYARALTRQGQVSDGARGAHGGHGQAGVLGFTNTRRLADLDRSIETARAALRAAAEEYRGADLALEGAAELDVAARLVLDATWEDVDTAGAQARCDEWSRTIDKARGEHPELDELRAREADLRGRIDRITRDLGAAEDRARALDAEWTQVVDAVDAAQQVVDAGQDAVVPDALAAYLDEVLGVPEAPGTPAPDPAVALRDFDAVIARADERLRHDHETAATAVASGRAALQSTFEAFVLKWPDPDLGTDPEKSFADFDRLLTDLETRGLHEVETQWRRHLHRLTGSDLTDLEATMARARAEITERIDPVNQILAGLPFADDDHRLRIDARPVESAVVARFRKELRGARTPLPDGASDADREQRYLRMARLIDRIRPGSPDRADLIDVRRHVRVSAEKTDLDGNHVALYDHIGEKSGGESQELVAFIVGAALRYQLGDAGADRPRYAPVFLDEALIKADARFSGRAVGAWRGLGFQLVIGAPNDKVSALEPHCDATYLVIKNDRGHSFPKPIVGLADTAAINPAGD